MPPSVSRKLSYLQFVCALMIIGLHTAFARYFEPNAPWTVDLNTAVRNVYDAAISTFFFLSAMLFFRSDRPRTYAGVLKDKARTLLIPYVLWNARYLAHSTLRHYLVHGVWPVLRLEDVLLGLTFQPANSIFWFVKTLMGFVLLFPVWDWCVRRRWPALVLGVGAAAAVCVASLEIAYESMIYWLPVYLMGAYAGRHRRALMERVPLFSRRLPYALCAAVWAGWALLRPLGHAIHYLYWLPAPLLLWTLADGFASWPAPPWWIRASFYLYGSHLVVEHYAVELYLRTMGTSDISFALGNVLLPCLCAAVALVCGAVVRRLLPGVYALFTGAREKR